VSEANRRLATVLWCAGLAAFAAMYAPQGLLTEIAREASVDPSRASLLVSAATLGLALSVLPWAWLSDRMGIRSAIRLAAAGVAVCSVTVPWLPSYAGLLGGRFLQGIALGGIPALAMALLYDTATPKRAATLAGSYVAATSLGGLGGRLLVVPVADHFGWRLGLFLLGCLVAALMAALIGLIPRAPSNGPADQPEVGANAVFAHLRNPAMLVLFAIGALLVGGMMAVFNYLPFRLERPPYLLTPAVVSLVFLAYLAGTAGSRAAGWVTSRVGEVPILATACVLMTAGGAMTLARPLAIVLVGVVVLTAGLFIGHAVASSMVTARAPTGRAQAAALYNISYYAGSSAFGWLGGLAWLYAGWPLVATLVIVLGMSACALTGLVAQRGWHGPAAHSSDAIRKACDGQSFTASRACSSSPSGTSSTSTTTMPSSS
jgi:YNFM family putative membrane transporter